MSSHAKQNIKFDVKAVQSLKEFPTVLVITFGKWLFGFTSLEFIDRFDKVE